MSDARITRPPPGAHRKIVALYEYWQRIAPAPGVLPGRRHLDPTDIPKLLSNIWLVDVVGPPRRFRARLVGTTLQRAGLPLRPGVFVEDPIKPELKEKVLANFRFVADTRQPLWYRGEANAPHDSEIYELERIFLPLAADGANVDMLLNLSVLYVSTGFEW